MNTEKRILCFSTSWHFMFLKVHKEGCFYCEPGVATITDSFIYFTNINGVPGTVPAAGDLAGNKTDHFYPSGVSILHDLN